MSTISYPAARGPAGVRIYAIGDIHGRLDLLTQLHQTIADEIERDRTGDWLVVHLGDYVDRGPETRGVLSFLLDRVSSDQRFVMLLGNHDAGMLDFVAEPSRDSLFARYGGIETAFSYGVELDLSSEGGLARTHGDFVRAVPGRHLRLLAQARTSLTAGDFFFCHAGIRPGVALDRQKKDDLIWIREGFLDHPGLHPKVVVHGHTIVPTPDIHPNRVNVDTGAYHSGMLTALVIDGAEKRLISTSA